MNGSDPNVERTVNNLLVLAEALRQGMNIGVVVVQLNHALGTMGAEAYNVGDFFRCYGALHDVANAIVAQGKKDRSAILVPTRN